MYTQHNVDYLHVGGTAEKTLSNFAGSMNTGEIGIFTPEGVRMTEATAATQTRFVIATKLADGTIVQTPAIRKADIKDAKRLVYAAATQQVDFIGYNGTSGSIEAINNNLYRIHIQLQELLRSNSDGRRVKFAVYKSDASATQAEIAIGLAGSIALNFDREAEKYIVGQALCNNAGVANAGAGTITVAKGSKYVTFGTDVDAVAAVGDFIRFDESAGAAPAAGTDSVYKVVAMDTTNEVMTLDRPYQSTSLSAVAEGNAVIITAALGAAANWGISLTGQALDFKVGKLNYEVVSWETQLADFGTTTETFKSTAASPGSGVINQMKQLEWFAWGNEGEHYREGFSSIDAARTNVDSAVAGGGYDMIRLVIDSTDTVSFSKNVSPFVVTLISPATAPNYVTGTADDITDVLEVLAFGSANGNLAL